MSTHLNVDQIGRFREQKLPADELLAADEHLAECAECREALRAAGAEEASGMLAALRFEPNRHLTYEQMEGLVDGTLDPEEKGLAEIHLEDCGLCAGELEDLRAFDNLLARPVSSGEIAVAPTPIFAQLWAWLATPQGAAIAAALLLAAALGPWMSTRRGGPEERAARVESASNDAAPMAPMASPPTLSEAPAAARQAARDGLLLSPDRTERLKEILEAADSGEQELAARGPRVTTPQLSPLDEALLETRPVFRWNPQGLSAPLAVLVLDENGAEVASNDAAQGDSWEMPSDLERGAIYSWRLSAGSQPRGQTRFRILSAEEAEMWIRALEQYNDQPLLLGALAQDLGMISEAERRYLEAPDTPQKRRLIDKLRGNREGQL